MSERKNSMPEITVKNGSKMSPKIEKNSNGEKQYVIMPLSSTRLMNQENIKQKGILRGIGRKTNSIYEWTEKENSIKHNE